MTDRSTPIVVEAVVSQDSGSVWQAITDVKLMTQWFFEDIPEFKAKIGFRTNFAVHVEDRTYTHQWEILEVVNERLIKYKWTYEEIPGVGYVTFELTPEDTGTKITLTNTGLETFPADLPEFTRESCLGGWQYFIEGNLRNFLAQ